MLDADHDREPPPHAQLTHGLAPPYAGRANLAAHRRREPDDDARDVNVCEQLPDGATA